MSTWRHRPRTTWRDFPRRATGFDDERPQPDEAPEPWAPMHEGHHGWDADDRDGDDGDDVTYV
jgi:hypothetical protein